ncbi:uncharacterized protein LOC144449933 [Glandiceps talaboti]
MQDSESVNLSISKKICLVFTENGKEFTTNRSHDCFGSDSSTERTKISDSDSISLLNPKDCYYIWEEVRCTNKLDKISHSFEASSKMILQQLQEDTLSSKDKTTILNFLCQTGAVDVQVVSSNPKTDSQQSMKTLPRKETLQSINPHISLGSRSPGNNKTSNYSDRQMIVSGGLLIDGHPEDKSPGNTKGNNNIGSRQRPMLNTSNSHQRPMSSNKSNRGLLSEGASRSVSERASRSVSEGASRSVSEGASRPLSEGSSRLLPEGASRKGLIPSISRSICNSYKRSRKFRLGKPRRFGMKPVTISNYNEMEDSIMMDDCILLEDQDGQRNEPIQDLDRETPPTTNQNLSDVPGRSMNFSDSVPILDAYTDSIFPKKATATSGKPSAIANEIEASESTIFPSTNWIAEESVAITRDACLETEQSGKPGHSGQTTLKGIGEQTVEKTSQDVLSSDSASITTQGEPSNKSLPSPQGKESITGEIQKGRLIREDWLGVEQIESQGKESIPGEITKARLIREDSLGGAQIEPQGKESIPGKITKARLIREDSLGGAQIEPQGKESIPGEITKATLHREDSLGVSQTESHVAHSLEDKKISHTDSTHQEVHHDKARGTRADSENQVQIKEEPNLKDECNTFHVVEDSNSSHHLNSSETSENSSDSDSRLKFEEGMAYPGRAFDDLSYSPKGNTESFQGSADFMESQSSSQKPSTSYQYNQMNAANFQFENNDTKMESMTHPENDNYLFAVNQYLAQNTDETAEFGFDESGVELSHTEGENAKKSFLCIECGKKFMHKRSLVFHMRMHNEKKIYQCKICGAKTLWRSSFRRHLKLHTGEELFSCQYCGKNFQTKTILECHLRGHTGERPFQCEICKKSFRQKNVLKTHMRTHSGERPFECPYCKKNYISKDYLTKHVKYHTEKKSFQCAECGAIFDNKRALNSHMWVHSVEGAYLNEKNPSAPVNID